MTINARTYRTADLTSNDETITIPYSVVVTENSYVLATYDGQPDAPYDDLETLAKEHGLSVDEILACDGGSSTFGEDVLRDVWARAVAHYPDLNQPRWAEAFGD